MALPWAWFGRQMADGSRITIGFIPTRSVPTISRLSPKCWSARLTVPADQSHPQGRRTQQTRGDLWHSKTSGMMLTNLRPPPVRAAGIGHRQSLGLISPSLCSGTVSERLAFSSAAPQLSHLAIDQPAGLPHRVDVILCSQDLRTFDVLPLEMIKPILEHCTLPDVWIEGAYLHRVPMG